MHDLNDKAPEVDQLASGARSARGANGEAVKNRKRSKWTVVLIVSVVVLIGSLTALGVIAFSYLQGQQKYDLLDQFVSDDVSGDAETSGGLAVDWDALLAINPQTVAWVYMPNTSISYPVVQTDDNDYYLTHDFDEDQGWLANYGSIFMDYRNNPNWNDGAYFIYGHHMKDGSMFADLAKLRLQERFDECRTMYLLSPRGNFKLHTFTLIHCAADDAIVQTTFETRDDMAAYVKDKEDRSIVYVDDMPAPGRVGKVFAFATCDNILEGRYVLYAYVEKTTADGLEGQIGLWEEDGQTGGFIDELQSE